MPVRSWGAVSVLAPAAAGVLAIPLTDPTSAVPDAVYGAAVTWSVLVAGLAVRRHAPERRRPWVLLVGGLACWLLGDALWALLDSGPGEPATPSIADVAYLAGYPLLAASLLLLTRVRRTDGDRTAVLDAAIVTTGVAVVAVVFVVGPLVGAGTQSAFGGVVGAAYPIADVLLLALLARLWTTAPSRTASYRLLVAGIVAALAADSAYNVDRLAGGTGAPWIDATWLSSYVLLAAAAAHPSMVQLCEPAPQPPRRLTTGRLRALATAAVLPPASLLVQGVRGAAVPWGVVGVGSVVLFCLVLARMSGLLRQIEVQAVQMAALAQRDALTGLANRRTWDSELSDACARSAESGRLLSIALLDMDRFKAYNDAYGHQTGDRLLQDSARAWQAMLGTGTVLARYGGEEFAMLLPGRTESEAATLVAALRAVTPDEQTFSAGVALWDPGEEPASVVARADQAMYDAKRGGRDRVHTADHGLVAVAGLPVSAAGDQPVPVFQPVVDVATGQVVAYEALARFGAVGGDVKRRFDLAHADGYGARLEASMVVAAMNASGRPAGTALHVNASAAALRDDRFCAALPAVLDGVVIEVTEESFDVAPAVLAAALDALRARGARIALDDVGAGGEDLQRLVTLRPEIVKIDRSLVTGIDTAPTQRALVSALVRFARQVGALVCAEGVETRRELAILRGLGVDLAQGYLLGRPDARWLGRSQGAEPARESTDPHRGTALSAAGSGP